MKLPTVRYAVLMTALLSAAPAFAAEAGRNVEWTIVAEPVRVAAVDGDADRFSAHHWIDTGYAGGVREAEMTTSPYEGATLHAASHAIFDENDYGVELRLDDEDRGYYLLEWEEFRKYFDRTGGRYHPFSNLETADAPVDDLFVDIGDLKVEGYFDLKDLPNVTLTYAREYKRGKKSRLTWTGVTEGGPTKKTGPSWAEVDEATDDFEVKLNDTFQGADWYALQKWEFFEGYSVRHEPNLSTTATGSNNKVRRQELTPAAEGLTTQMGFERPIAKGRGYVSSGYRFSQIENEELENIFEFNQAGVLTNFSNPEAVRDATATNQYLSHTWVGHFMWTLFDPLKLITKLKTEGITRDSHSTYFKDSSPNAAGGVAPNGQIDQIDVSENDNKVRRIGEAVSLRYTGIPRTAMYVEYEGEQTRNWLSEDRQSASAGERFSRESIAHFWRNSGTLGFQTVPWDPVTLTGQLRHRRDDINYNNLRFSEPSASGARSVFIEGTDIFTDEVATKITYRVNEYFIPSFRYQRQDRDYVTWGVPDDQNHIESRQLSDTYTADLTFKPCKPAMSTLSYSFQDAYVDTPAADSATAEAPRYNADVQSWMLSTSVELGEKLWMDNLIRYSRANNYNDFTSIGLPYGADFNEWEASLGFRWQWKPNVSIEPEYTIYGYNPDEMADSGNYTAHVVWCRVKMEWS